MPEAWRRLGKWQATGDLDNDGVPDAVGPFNSHGGTVAISGKDGHVLWQREDTPGNFVQGMSTGGQTMVPLPRTCADFDGDGVPDLLLFHPVEGLSALSGKTGRTLWKAELKSRPLPPMNLYLLECCEFKRGGMPELLLAFSVTPPGPSISRRQLVLAVLSLKDGKTRWQTTIGPSDATFGSFGSLNRLRPGLADLDGDGVLDVVTWAIADDGTFEVRALSGVDGSVLWRRSLARAAQPNAWPWPGVAVGNLGDRSSIVVDCGNGEVWAFDAAGTRLWVWKGPAYPNPWQRPAPVFLDLPGGWGGVCISGLRTDSNGMLLRNPISAVVLDAQGHEVQRASGLAPVAGDPPGRLDYANYFRRFASRADGTDLLSVADGKLRLTRGGIERRHLVWEWPLPGGSGDLMDVLGAGERTTVVVRSGSTAYGLEGATGRESWRCFGPCPPTGLLPSVDSAEPPGVLFAEEGAATTCRLALEIGADGRCRPFPGKTIDPVPLPDDPRLLVPLPWWQALRDLRMLDWPSFLLLQIVLVVVLVLGRWTMWRFRRGAWGSGLLLSLLLIAVLALAKGFVYPRSGYWFHDAISLLNNPVHIVLFGLPALVFVGQVLVWAAQGRWRWVGLVLAWTVFLSLPLAIGWLLADRKHLGPTQHYSPVGWYSAWVWAAYVTGVLLVLARTAFALTSMRARSLLSPLVLSKREPKQLRRPLDAEEQARTL
jgi:hypothetical protein